MPVKFVCDECRRVLSVSRRKIGVSVNCPCCGKGVHVPTEADAKARIDALEERRRLRRLKRELKFPELAVFDEPHGASAAPKNSLSDPRRNQHEGIPSRTRRKTAPGKSEDDVPQASVATTPPVLDGPVSGESPVTDESSDWTADAKLPLDEQRDSKEFCAPTQDAQAQGTENTVTGSAVSEVHTERATSARLDRRRKAKEHHSQWLKAVAVMAFGAGLFIAGWWAGRSGVSTESWAESEIVISGGVMYTRANGETAADHGAVVIALPVDIYPQKRVDISGLLPGDSDSNPNHPGVLAIEEFGGAFARTDATGEFRLKLPSEGKYLVVMVSAHSLQSAMEKITVEDDAELSRYFSSGAGLIGKQRYRVTSELLRADGGRVSHLFQVGG
ncbi:MAG: hypothetical protein MPJ50_09795 [Pirellulales bacterium]|nr:hypothetical protein [Pirellulales bacterium]